MNQEYEIVYREIKKQYIKIKMGTEEEKKKHHDGYTQIVNTMITRITNGNQFRVYCYLCSLWNKEYNYAWPSITEIAKTLKMGRTTVVNSLKGLEDLGYIKKVQEKQEGSEHKNNRYYIFYIQVVEVKKYKVEQIENDEIIEIGTEELEDEILREYTVREFRRDE
jgi:predicted transcriptional regulator